MALKLIITFFLILTMQTAHSRPYFLTTGTFVPFFGKAQVSDSGGTEKLSYNPYFSAGMPILMSGRHYFTPEIGFNFYLDNPDKMFRSTTFFKFNFASKITDRFSVRYGISNNLYRISGKGGNNNLRNGNGYTSFPAPNKTVTSHYTTIDIGAEYFYKTLQSVRFDLNMMSVNKLENRAYNYILTLNFLR